MKKRHDQRGHRQAGNGSVHLQRGLIWQSLMVILMFGMLLCICCGRTCSAFGAEAKAERSQSEQAEIAQSEKTERSQSEQAEIAQSEKAESSQSEQAEIAQSKESESSQSKEAESSRNPGTKSSLSMETETDSRLEGETEPVHEPETEAFTEWMLQTIAGMGESAAESILPENLRQKVESMSLEEMAEYVEAASRLFHHPDFQALFQYEEVRDLAVTLLHNGLVFAAEDPKVTDKVFVAMGIDKEVIPVLFYLLEKSKDHSELLVRLKEIVTSEEANDLIDLLMGAQKKGIVTSAGIAPETEFEKTRQPASLKQAGNQNAKDDENEKPVEKSEGESPNQESEEENPVAEAIYRFGELLQESIEEVSRLEEEEAAREEEEQLERQKTAETLNRNIGTYLTLANMITDGTPWLIRVNQTTCVVTVYRVLTLETGSRQSYGLVTKHNLAELVAQRIIAGDSILKEAAEQLNAEQSNLKTTAEDAIVEMEPQTVTVYVPVYACPCSVGSPGHETPTGTFYIQDHLRWHELVGPTWGQWCCHFAPSYLFHSLPYERPNDPNSLEEGAYNMIGQPASHGCVRLTAVDAKYIFDHVPTGGQIEIFYGTEDDDLFGKPERPYVGEWAKGYDPTDPEFIPGSGL